MIKAAVGILALAGIGAQIAKVFLAVQIVAAVPVAYHQVKTDLNKAYVQYQSDVAHNQFMLNRHLQDIEQGVNTYGRTY